MADQINTSSDVIDALGGVTAVAKLVGARTNAVWNWRVRGLPPETFVVLSEALKAKGLDAPQSLWKMREAAGQN